MLLVFSRTLYYKLALKRIFLLGGCVAWRRGRQARVGKAEGCTACSNREPNREREAPRGAGRRKVMTMTSDMRGRLSELDLDL
jgi:hypothetical protein